MPLRKNSNYRHITLLNQFLKVFFLFYFKSKVSINKAIVSTLSFKRWITYTSVTIIIFKRSFQPKFAPLGLEYQIAFLSTSYFGHIETNDACSLPPQIDYIEVYTLRWFHLVFVFGHYLDIVGIYTSSNPSFIFFVGVLRLIHILNMVKMIYLELPLIISVVGGNSLPKTMW
jgi:hypothetical protein